MAFFFTTLTVSKIIKVSIESLYSITTVSTGSTSEGVEIEVQLLVANKINNMGIDIICLFLYIF